MVRGTLHRDDQGWCVEVYTTEPIRRTIVELRELPAWDEAFTTMSAALRLLA